ncbi:DNA-binding MarR family transcriptional regulator [Diaminobutyricimonas aerilata]|uniref:DNA-binding MarR family transcriptional regulator n=1 Tax=Diaminobutyricimonas aerilata TaxID=1162967 RepID=A0A2M9CM91_9MICO|nr:MarR family winged helix-turn-helix transcriptional regulator [Diaminobutyricimonas aerilata]PJJ72988.1 DNA-binding MarR family transcriptional regulator [Diaminobutyricimonas aerilata]
MSDYDVSSESPYAFLDDREVRAWYAYMKVHLRLRYEMNRQLRADHGISLADYDVLVALVSDEHGTLTVSDLATRIGAERSRVSHHVQRMAGRDLLEMRPSSTDRRATDVVLTNAGRRLLADVSPSHIAFVRSVFLDTLTPGQLDQMAESFEGVYERLIAKGTLPRPADHP